MRSPDGGRFLCCYHVPTTNRRGGDHCLNNSGWGANAGHPNDGDDHTMVNTKNSATGYTTTKMDQTRGHTKCYTTDCASPMSSSSGLRRYVARSSLLSGVRAAPSMVSSRGVSWVPKMFSPL